MENLQNGQSVYQMNDSLFIESNFPVIATKRLILRKLEMYDAEDYFRLRSDEKTAFDMGVQAFEDLNSAKEMILSTNCSYEFMLGINWAICLKSDLKFIGDVSIWRIDREHFRGEIGYAIYPEFQRKGYMQEALEAVIKTAFKNLKLHSLEANVDPDNFKSIALLKKLNFEQEGYLKENYYLNGKFYDTAMFSLVNC